MTDQEQNPRENHPNFYGILPADVRYCKNIEAAAKVFYSEITALCSIEGYCWASNKYFCDIYGVDERTVRRWIESLKDEGFIRVEIIKRGFITQRRIYKNDSFKKSLREDETVRIERTKPSASTGQECPPYYYNVINTKEQQQPPTPKGGVAPAAPAVAVFYSNEVYECLNDVDIPDKLKKDFSRENTQEVVENAVKNLKQQSDIQCTAAYLTAAIKNKWKPKELPEDLSEKNKTTAKKYDQKENSCIKIECLDKSVEFILKGVQSDPIVLKYDSKGFEENFMKTLDKYKLK